MERPPSDVSITTERLDLRLMEPQDAQAAFETYTSDPQAARYMVFKTQTSAAETLEFFKRQRDAFAEGKTILWAIRLKTDPALVGAIELRLDGDEGEVGFIIGRSYWGHGIVPEAVAGIIEFARAHLKLQRIRGQCDLENLQSARVFEKCGFQSLGIARQAVLHPQMSPELRDSQRFVLEL
jgi:ribosomal-protein-alanine N-acetyltransferase